MVEPTPSTPPSRGPVDFAALLNPDDPADPVVLDRLTAGAGELATGLRIRFTSVSVEELVATMPVVGNRQPFGLLHGGATAALAETLGSVHAALLASPGHHPVGLELNCTHHRAATEGLVLARCRPLSVGRTLAALEVVTVDARDRRINTARLTCLYRATP